MSQMHAVKEGDTLISIAHEYEFRDWRTLWDHDSNATLRSKRPDPQQLTAGDQVFIPDKKPRVESCVTEKKHRFKLRKLRSMLRLSLEDANGNAYVGKRYKLEAAGTTISGKTGARGMLELEVPADAKTGKLSLWVTDETGHDPLTWDLAIGGLDPIGEGRGLEARLANLGYHASTTAAALQAFQRDHDLPETGTLDDATRTRLEQAHDSV